MSYPPAGFPIRGALPQGARLNDHYEIDAFLKAGGMGEVYRGHEIETGDPVAIKLIRDRMAGDEAVLAMFRNEASALRRIHHQAIVRYFGFTLEPRLRRHYLAMEFVEGTPLSELLDSGPLPVPDVLALLRRLALGLQAAHEQNVVHRDVSPDNVIVPESGIAYSRIIDFGIARSLRVGDGTVIGGGFAGKHKYVSPEQLGLFGGDVRAASDIYSLGLVLAQCLIGAPLPMEGSQLEIIENRRRAPDLSGVDPIMRPLLAAMLQPDPAARPRSMAEVAYWTPDPLGSRGETVFAPPPRTPAIAAAPALADIEPVCSQGRSEAPATHARKLAPIRIAAATASVLAFGAAAFAGWSFFRGDDPKATTENPQGAQQASTGGAEIATSADPPRPDPFVRIREFTRDFDGGDCFLATPSAISAESVEIDGFGRGREPFDELDKSFKNAIGVPASITVRTVVTAQCPALSFAKRFLTVDDLPRFEIARTRLQRAGDRLEGAIETRADHVRFLVVDDDGLVSDLTSRLGREPGRRDFAMELRSTRPGPVVLLAIASAQPVSITSVARSISAKELFSRLSDELAPMSPPPAVAVKHIMLVSGR